MKLPNFSRIGVAFIAMVAVCCASTARADMLELTNGDHYRGTIVSMDASNVVFLSEVQGRVVLPRNKIATVTLREVTPKHAAKITTPSEGSTEVVTSNAASIAPAAPTTVKSGSQADAVVEELRKQGIDPKLIDQVQEQIFGKSSPEAAQKFNEMMGGLLTGQLSVSDVRKQAQNSINQIKAAKKDLGGGDAGEMLDGYLSILQKFVDESASDNTISTPANPAPKQ